MALPLLAIGAASAGISALTGAYQMYKGNQQEKEGKNALKNLVAPNYQIPEELQKNLTESELRALEGLPTAQKNQYIQNVQRQQQETLNAAADRKGGLLGIQESARNATDAYTNLVSMDAEARVRNQQQVQQNRLAIADAKDKQFAYKEGRYQDGLQSAQAMIGAGKQNFAGGLDTIAGSALQAGSMLLANGGGNKVGNTDTTGVTGGITNDKIAAADTITKLPYQHLIGRQ